MHKFNVGDKVKITHITGFCKEWWTVGKEYYVVDKHGDFGIFSDDGEFYSQERLNRLDTGFIRWELIKQGLTTHDCWYQGVYQGRVSILFEGDEFILLKNHTNNWEQTGKKIDYKLIPIDTKRKEWMEESSKIMDYVVGPDSEALGKLYDAMKDGKLDVPK